MKDIQQLYTKHILAFIEDVSFINEKALERAAKVPKGTIAIARTGRRLIPKNGIYQLMFELAKCGLRDIHGYMLTPDPQTFCITGLKPKGMAFMQSEDKIIYTSYFDLL